MKTYTIYLFRHGLTKGNLNAQYIVHTDLPLTTDSISQLKSIKAHEHYPKVDAVFSSPLKRCLDSAKIMFPENNALVIDDFIEYNLGLLNDCDYKLNDIILHSDRGGMYKSGIYNTKTAEMNLIPSMSAPYTYTHNPWIETINGQFKDFIKNNYPKNLDELQIALNKFVYYNNNIKIKNKLKTTPIKYRCSHS